MQDRAWSITTVYHVEQENKQNDKRTARYAGRLHDRDILGGVLADSARWTFAVFKRTDWLLGFRELDLDVGQLGGVAVLLVHRDHAHRWTDGVHIVQGDVARQAATSAARTVELAEVLRVEAINGDQTFAVVLDDLVRSVTRTTADDLGDTLGVAALDTQRVFAHILPPHVLNHAVVLVAVHAFHLVLADDHIAQRGTGLQEEHGVLLLALLLLKALHVRAFVGLHAAVEDRTSLDDVRRVVLDETLAGRPSARRHGCTRDKRSGGSESDCNGGDELDHSCWCALLGS